MGRFRVIGSYIGPATVGFPDVPYAIMMEPGGISAVAAADASLFPVELSPEELTKYRWLIRAWKINVTYHMPSAGGFAEETGEVEIIHASAATEEADLGTDEPPSFNGGSGASVTGTRTVDNGVDPPVVTSWEPGSSLNVCGRGSDFIPPDAPDTNNYYYNTASELYLPRVEFELSGAAGFGFITATNYDQADDANVNTTVDTFSGTWDGQPITLRVNNYTAHPLDDFTFTAVRYRYWTYTGASGAIWDSVTGAESSPNAHSTIRD